ncbi:MAG TPA: choice-of-anchor J domain-containing protein, partial [Herpetosiphonaceae bacterium]
MKRLSLIVVILLGLASSLVVRTSFAGASFAEGFDNTGATGSPTSGPANLISAGWIFRNQSQPLGSSSWYGSGSTQAFGPHSGTGFLAADYTSTSWVSGSAISNWAILPVVPGQTAGDVMRFVVQASVYTFRQDRIQVRYSPTGGTSTGSSAGDVGDFTTLLLDINPVPSGADWVAQNVTLPGAGRIAFRYYLPQTGSGTQTGGFFGIDTLVVGTPPAGSLPIPQPGQTVTWTQAMSPVVITGRQTIPAGGTVVVESGVEIQVQQNSTLVVEGTVRGAGTAPSPIRVTAPAVYPPALHVFGTLDLTHATIGGQVRADSGGSLLFSNARFQTYGTLTSTNGLTNYKPPFVRIDQSHFEGTDLYVSDISVVLRDTTFHNGSPIFLYSYLYLNNVTVDGGTLSISNDYQPGYLNNVTIRNSPQAGISLGGGNWGNDYFIGPSVVLQNNLYPVAVGDGGILPGSTVPATGNVNNYIAGPGDGDHRGPVTWSNVGIPYVITGFPDIDFGEDWNVLPGTTIKFGPSAGAAGGFVARGEPGAPVKFERLNSTQPWSDLREPRRLEHVIVDGSQYGLVFSSLGAPRYVDSAILRNNARAAVGSVVIRGTQFLNNTVGANVGATSDLNGLTNPNSFVGNGTGVQSASDARYNWWGNASGPTSPDNARGTGDSAASGVPIKPFLTTAPDYSNSAPIVHLRTPSFLAEPGQKIMLNWDAQDNGAIASQKILFSPDSGGTQTYTVVADNLPATQRAFEWTVPNIGFQNSNPTATIRVVAVDSTGREGWDAAEVVIPSGEATGNLTITSDLRGPFRAGDNVPICWTASGLGLYADSFEAFLFLDGNQRTVPLGGLATPGCLSLPLTMPFVSTDSARVGVKIYGTYNRVKWFFSEPFTIRPDSRIPDAAPTVTLLSPTNGASITPGSVVPITWSA